MKHLFALCAIATTAWAYSPSVHADESDFNADGASSILNPGPGFGGPGHGGPGGPGPGFGGPGHGGPGGPGPGFGGPGHGGPGPGPGFGGPGHGGPGGPGFGGPGHGGPGGPGFGGPGHGGPGPGPGFGGPGRPGPGPGPGPGFGGPGRPGPGWDHHDGWGARPGWRPGFGPGRPGWNPGFNGHWERPGMWRVPHRGFGWWPSMFIPLPPPPPEMGDYLCYGNFTGVFGADRDAYISLDTNNDYVNGSLVIEDPEASYSISGTCIQVGETADVQISLNGNQPYVGQIYRADDGQVYFQGSQAGTNISFTMQRQ